MTAPSVEDATPTRRSRPVRRGPADLPFTFPTADLAQALGSERAEPEWLRTDRAAAAEAYESLPLEQNQLYTTYVDLRTADLTGATPYVRTASSPAAGPAETVPDGAAAMIELREDGVTTVALGEEARRAGVILETFGAALDRDRAGLQADFEGGPHLPGDDKLAQLTRAFWSQGVRLLVPDGVVLADPIVVRWEAGVPDRALITRTLVRIGAGARAAIVEELLPSGPEIACAEGEPVPQSLFTGTFEVELGDGADLAVASIQDLPTGVTAFQHRNAVLGERARLRWALAQLGARVLRSRVDNRLEGDRSSVEQVEIVFGSGEQVVDLTSYTRHVGRDTTGNLLSKGALMDRSRSFMKGLITIEKSAIGTDSFLGEFGMNLSRQARAVAIPSLEIDQPDCRRAMHSSSVGPVDELQLFYLESRGIPPEDARKYIVLGFLEPVVARVTLPAAQDRLRELLEAKWAASAGSIASSPAA
ncbi:MAG: SufD family Fe-S cluster assembly protein [Chloroflexi bacterium]|nr:MAG: SufD family Fe-S cluster assembly protein [Chloroflexota bacterium]